MAKMMAAPLEPTADLQGGAPRELFDPPGFENGFSVAPDATRLLMMLLLAPRRRAADPGLSLSC